MSGCQEMDRSPCTSGISGSQPLLDRGPVNSFFYKTRARYNWVQGPVVEKHCPRSPVLSPLNFLWGHLKSVLRANRPRTIKAQKERIHGECDKISSVTLHAIAGSTERRVYNCKILERITVWSFARISQWLQNFVTRRIISLSNAEWVSGSTLIGLISREDFTTYRHLPGGCRENHEKPLVWIPGVQADIQNKCL
jgi:hypothetical protein